MWNSSSGKRFSARSEGCQHRLEATHNPKVVGSHPTPATRDDEGLADAATASPFRLPRLHPGIAYAWQSRAPRLGVSSPEPGVSLGSPVASRQRKDLDLIATAARSRGHPEDPRAPGPLPSGSSPGPAPPAPAAAALS